MELRTSRLITSALSHLRNGLSIVVVAHPAHTAWALAEEIKQSADREGVVAELSDDGMIDYSASTPRIYMRPLDQEAYMLRRCDPPSVVVLIDRSACQDGRACVDVGSRSVITRMERVETGVRA